MFRQKPSRKITDVRVVHDEIIVQYQDGHRAVFEAYRHGFGYQVEGWRGFTLYNGDTAVVVFNGRLRRQGPGNDEHRFARVGEGYTQELILSYWESARIHAQRQFDKDKDNGTNWFAWIVICCQGGMDFMDVQEGRIPVPVSAG